MSVCVPALLLLDNALRWSVRRLFLMGVGMLHHSILADKAFAAGEWYAGTCVGTGQSYG